MSGNARQDGNLNQPQVSTPAPGCFFGPRVPDPLRAQSRRIGPSLYATFESCRLVDSVRRLLRQKKLPGVKIAAVGASSDACLMQSSKADRDGPPEGGVMAYGIG